MAFARDTHQQNWALQDACGGAPARLAKGFVMRSDLFLQAAPSDHVGFRIRVASACSFVAGEVEFKAAPQEWLLGLVAKGVKVASISHPPAHMRPSADACVKGKTDASAVTLDNRRSGHRRLGRAWLYLDNPIQRIAWSAKSTG